MKLPRVLYEQHNQKLIVLRNSEVRLFFIKCVKSIRLTSVFRKFVRMFAEIARPLTDLTKKDVNLKI